MTYPTVQELYDLHGQVAIVTGGARNLGLQIAEALAEVGAAVVVTARSKDAAVTAAHQLAKAKGVRTLGLELEITEEAAWSALVQKVEDEFGKIDILVNNAGGRDARPAAPDPNIPLDVPFLEARSPEEWRRLVDVNLTSVFLGCRAVVPAMKRNGRGKIVNIASTDGMLGRDLELYNGSGQSASVPDYLASKAGVINLTRGIAVVLAPYDIYVNCLSPAGFQRSQPPAFIEKYSKMFPLKRMGRDGIDLKGPIVLLCSAASDFMVGHNLVVDGGFTAW
ncbi:MAG: SDR family oxidoreductase [Anaerolineae bacterium]|nr:SDR family oxidoreductase [Anaerolineae bacterium]